MTIVTTTAPLPPKKRQIMAAGEALFNRYGIKRVTVEEICRKAQVSKMTFYKYFSNKINLLNDIWRVWMDDRCEKITEVDSRDLPFIEKITLLFELKSTFLSQFSTEFIREAMEIQLDFQKIMDGFIGVIVNAQKRGEVRSSIQPRFVIAVLEKINEMAKDPDLMAVYADLLSFRNEAFTFFLYGVAEKPKSGAAD